MALTVFGSHKGSPGATLTALAVAAAWPSDDGRKRILVEADPSGGALAMRYGLSRDPGLLTLATAVRHGMATAEEILTNTQVLPGGLFTVLAPEHASSVDAAFRVSGLALGKTLSEATEFDVIVDVGRLSPSSPASSLLTVADAVFMVARPTPEQIVPGAEVLKSIPNGRWCLIGEKPYSAEHVADTFGVPAFVIADDARGAKAIESGGSAKTVRRSALMRSARELAEAIDGAVNASLPESPAPVPEPEPQSMFSDSGSSDPASEVSSSVVTPQ